MRTSDLSTPWLDVPADPVDLLELATEEGWGDGLPLIPPTAERVSAHLETVAESSEEGLGRMPPGQGTITPANLAANAVMAGCPAEAFPVVLAAVQAMMDPAFNLNGVQTTTHPVAPLVIVHGPVVDRLGVNAGPGVFGPGNRVNATIGRAIRLALLHIGHAYPGERDRATQGQPSKYSFCIGENSGQTPWKTYTEQHLDADVPVDAVTVFAGENPHNVNDHVSTSAAGVLDTVAAAIANPASNPVHYSRGEVFVILSPEHADTVASDGFELEDVQLYLFDKARLPLRRLQRGNMWGMQAWPAWMEAVSDPEALLPPVSAPDGFRIVVAGGPGKHSSVLPGFGASNCVTVPLGTGA